LSEFFLGVDVGSSKTHAIIADTTGNIAGFGESGAGNHETVGYEGLARAICRAANGACSAAGIQLEQVCGAGFGVAGYDWPSERESTLNAIAQLGLSCRFEAVNDAVLGLLAGTEEGWGITVVSGTGCNCWGWDKTRQKIGRVTGNGAWMGEAAGASELVNQAVKAVAYEWSRRGPTTELSPAFVKRTGAQSLDDLLDGLNTERYRIDASAAPLVFAVAREGDSVALDLIRWAGKELGELVEAVVRQLEFERTAFDLVMVGSMFLGGPLLIDAMRDKILASAPEARLVNLTKPPVIGAVILGIEQAGRKLDLLMRKNLENTFKW
jgi:N-acetylglucosamine kinase-like BadF-type ATPase